jgi:hypothetical protein
MHVKALSNCAGVTAGMALYTAIRGARPSEEITLKRTKR